MEYRTGFGGERMIDTDKYEEYQNARVEGFIPPEWEFEDYLLAEVKRLREENDKLHAQRVQFSWIQEARGGQSDKSALLAEVKRLRESDGQWETHWLFVRNWLEEQMSVDNTVSTKHTIPIYTTVWRVMEALRPRGEEE
jgi:hypothetical protein